MYGPRGSIVSNEIPWVQQMPPVPENLVMDREIQFAKKKTLTVTHNVAILLLLAFFGCVIAVGLLVFYLAPCPNGTSKESLNSGNASHVFVVDESTENLPEQTTLEPSISETTTTEFWTTTPSSGGRYVRLPRSVTPKEYNLTFVPFLTNFTFLGTVSILLNVTEPTKNITLHALELTIDDTSVQVRKVDGGGISGRKYETDKELQFFVVQFEKELDVGEYVIRMNYTGILNDVLQGFYRSSYRRDNETRWLAATQFQPTDARRAFPCFDEPALKATFKISIARPGNMSSVSNMPKFKTEPALGISDYEWDHFQKSVPMSTYLVAFVVSDFKPRSNKNFSVWARGDAYDQTVYSMDFGPRVLKFYEEFFKIPFPLPKIDMFAIPDFSAGAMENWGLITYRESTLLYEDNISTRRNKQRIATVIAHELGHQWFGNLVTPSWWTDLWLNEGFATYLEYIGTNAVNPEWKMLDQFVNELHSVFDLDALKSSHQISIEVNDPDEISYIFDKISYSKGATIIRMMEHFLTTDVFKRGLTNYLKANEYGNAEQNDLWKFLTDEGHKEGVLEPNMNVKTIMDTWTLQTGYPVINVARNYKRGGARFTQSRFLVNTNSTDPNNSMWWVPITYKSPTTNVTKTWLRKEQQVTVSYAARSNEWLLVNVNQTGYYRVNYDRHNWELLVQQLKKDHTVFDPKNRAQIIDDSFNLANAGLLDYNIALNISTYLTQEKELVPWTAAFLRIDYIYEMFLRSGKFEEFKNYLMHLITPLYKNVGFRDGYSDPLLLTSIRNSVLMRACKLGLRDCVDNAARQFQNWKATQDPDKYNPISPNLKGVVYCTAIRVGGEEEWDFAWQRYLNTNVGSERELLLGALGCTREAWLLNKYLNLAVTEGSGIRKQDATSVFSHVSSNIVGQPLAFAFVTSQWERVKNYLGTSFSSVNSIIRYVANNFNTELEMENVNSFATKRAKDLGAASRSIKQSLESIETNIQWMEQHYQTIVTWLEENQKTWS